MAQSRYEEISDRIAKLKEGYTSELDAKVASALASLRELPSTHEENHNPECMDVLGRPVSLNSSIDREANMRFSNEANTLFGAAARRKYAEQIDHAKHAAAKSSVDNIRLYSNYISLGTGVIMACISSDFTSLPMSFAIGVISAISTNLVLPSALDRLKDVAASNAEAQVKVKVKAVY